MKVSLVSVTQPLIHPEGKTLTPEDLMVYCARVSSPKNQGAVETGARLLRYCLRNKHWSVFETVDMTVEIETSRAIAAQILRHRSFTFQEFSQRYASAELGFETVEARRQDTKNRQNSIDDLNPSTKADFEWAQKNIQAYTQYRYALALEQGIAKEQARFLLPLSTTTRLYMKGSVRSWIHYLEARTHPSTQEEHRDVAEAIKSVFYDQFPVTAAALEETAHEAETLADLQKVHKQLAEEYENLCRRLETLGVKP